MDIPLPDEEPPIKESIDESLADIPVPEDTNRYSPSLPIEDDPTDFKNDVAAISLPSASQKLPVPPTVSVLGKEAAKKRLLAFSQAKQSFISQKRKPSVQAVLEGNVLKENDAKSILPKKKKKGVLDKARDTISEIEELKRRENEVMETMQVLFPMWSNLDKKSTPVTSQINQDGVVEKSDKIENVVEKLLSKKMKHERKEQERLERLEERKRKRERREKEIRRLMPKSWAEFTKSGFKAYHFRRQKFRLEKLSGGRERTRSHEHEREGSKRINLLDTPMVLKKSFVVCGLNGEDVEFPCWAVRYTNTWPPLSYCLSPKYDTKCLISRKEMLSTLPEDVYLIVKKFLSSTCLNKFNEVKPESNRSWWKRDSFLIPGNNLADPRSDMKTNDSAQDMFHGNLLVSNSTLYDPSDYSKENKNEELDKSSCRSLSGSVFPSSEGPTSDNEKSYSSEMSEVEEFTVNKSFTDKEESKNEENLASEYEQFIKTIGPDTDNKEVSKRTGRADEIWSDVSEKKEILSGSSSATTKKKLGVEDRKKSRDKKLRKEKRKKIKKKTKKRSHSSDSSSSESTSSSSRSSSSSSDSSSTTSTSSSSSSSGDSSSSSSSSSTSSSNDSSSESSSSTSSSGSTTSSDSRSFEGKSKKKLRRKRLSKKTIISGRKGKNKKFAKLENEDEKALIKKKKKKRNDDSDKDDKGKLVHETKSCDLKNVMGSSEKSLTELTEGPEESLIDRSEVRDSPGIVTEEKVNQDEIYEPRDSPPQSRTSDESESDSSLSNSSLKSVTSEPVLSNEQKDTNNSLHWNSGEDSVSDLAAEQDAHENYLDKPPEGKRHFNIDMFQESHNCTPDVNDTRQSLVENTSRTDSKEESKEEHDNTSSRVLPQSEEESALKSLERYSPTAEDDDDEEYEDFLTSNASGGGSTVDEASSQLVSFGVNSASEEARMLDIPLPPPIEAPSEAPTSFRNILQLPSSPNQQSHQLDLKKKNIVLVGKSPVARLTFGKQVMKLKPISIFSTEDSDSEADKTPFPPSAVSETNEANVLSSSGVIEAKEDNCTQESANLSQITNEIINNQASVSELGDANAKPVNVVLDSSSPLSKKSRWDQEAFKSEERDCIGDVAERSLLINPPSEIADNSERKVSDFQPVLNVPEFLEKVKGKTKKEDSRSPIPNDKKRRRERSHSSERDRRRRERGWSPRDRGRFSRGRRRDFRKRSHSKERRSRRDSPHREFSPSWRKGSPQGKSLRRSPSAEGEQRKMLEKSLRNENIGTNREVTNEPSPTFDSSWNKSELNSNDIIKDSYNSSPKKKESLSDWDSPERRYSPSSRKESPKRKKSPITRDSPFRSPRRKESPMRKRSPENRKESPSRRYSPRRSPMPWKRSSPDRRRSPYSPRRSPVRRRASPDRKRPSSPYRRRSPASPERKYSGRYMKKSPLKHAAYSDSPSREENWNWEEDKGAEKRAGVEGERFPKWDYEAAAQGDAGSDYQTSLADSTISDSELVKEPPSPKRMSLDERLKIELGHGNTNIEPEPPQNPMPSFHNLYYPPPAVPDQVGYFPHQQFSVNHQPPPRPPPGWNPAVHPPQLPNKLVQVGNVLQVVPTEIPVEPVFSTPPPKIVRNVEAVGPKVLQVGNVLQVVPSQEPPPPQGLLPPQFNASIAPPAPVAAPVPKVTPPPQQPAPPVSIISLPFPPGTGSPNVFLKMEEKERRRKEKELRKEKKEQKVARRMLRKAMLKKRLAKANEPDNEINTCGAEVGSNESGELDPPKAAVVLPSPDKGILIGLKDTVVLTSTKKKSVSFADGIKPGEGTSPSGGEEHPLSPPPLIRKPIKKRKKRKVKVRIIRIDSNAKEEESEEDDLSPPPPPPGTPPPEAYIEYTASGRYLYPVSASQPFPGNQDSGTVFPPLPAVSASPAAVVQFAAPPLPQPR